jgi:DNA topoisomerase-1
MNDNKGNLVIVESPAKSKTIEKYLGSNFIVRYSMGHVVDLPEKAMGVNIKDNFKPFYVIIQGKKKIVQALKKDAATRDTIWLASDPDREGEAISWHLMKLLGKGKTVHRVTFNEITKPAIKFAFNNPGKIDMKKVNAQQARRILDRILGYTLSPLLWKKVGRGLSAGRVQSVALRIIVEREKEIISFKPQEYWEIEAEFEKINDENNKFKAKLIKINGEKAEIKNREKVDSILEELSAEKFIVTKIEEKERKQNPPSPFTTSKLQQDAFNKLRFSASKTMLIAQQLYEGIDMADEGRVGFITYMRTDSMRIANEAIKEIRDFISNNFGEEFLPESPNIYKSKKRTQEAHEAIRPTSVFRTPKNVKKYLTEDQYKLYELIWKRTIASQILPAKFLQKIIDINANGFLFQAVGRKLLFAGFTIIYDIPDETLLPDLSLQEELKLIQFFPSQHFTKPPPRYTDASLVKVLEEKGIGRPSTYAPIIRTLIARDYIRRKSGKFIPTELGLLITELLVKHFPKIIDLKFTANIEDELDKIEEGKIDWINVVKEFYQPFSEQLEIAKEEMRDMKKEIEETSIKCELCGKPMVIRWGKRGKFLGCSGFPQCKNTKPLTTTEIPCPTEGCGGMLVERRNKRGKIFYGCSNYPKCNFTTNNLKNAETNK